MKPALITLAMKVSHPDGYTIVPEEYLKAAGEMLAILFAVCGVVTYFTSPDTYKQNPLLDRLGYNNPCVTFDTKPASYFALALWAPTAYLCLAFAHHDCQRTFLTWRHDKATARSLVINVGADILYAVSTSLFSLVFSISPLTNGVDMWLHTMLYLQYIVFRLLVVIANFFEPAELLTLRQKVFLALYTLVSFAVPIMIVINYRFYDQHGYGPVTPVWLLKACDYGWFCCLPLTTYFMPQKALVATLALAAEQLPPAGTAGASESPWDDENEALHSKKTNTVTSP